MSKPSSNDEIWFSTGVVYARKIITSNKLFNFTGVHRGQMAKVDTGYLIIEKQWFPTSQSKS